MDGQFLAKTDKKSVDVVTKQFSEQAIENRYYSMIEIANSLYGVEFGTDEFWRVAVGVGDSLREIGWKQVNYKNRRFWVKRLKK
jgi:hypothetical protein